MLPMCWSERSDWQLQHPKQCTTDDSDPGALTFTTKIHRRQYFRENNTELPLHEQYLNRLHEAGVIPQPCDEKEEEKEQEERKECNAYSSKCSRRHIDWSSLPSSLQPHSFMPDARATRKQDQLRNMIDAVEEILTQMQMERECDTSSAPTPSATSNSPPSLHYPRSSLYSTLLTQPEYFLLTRKADYSDSEWNFTSSATQRALRYKQQIEWDRVLAARERGYVAEMKKMKPKECTPKNDIVSGRPCRRTATASTPSTLAPHPSSPSVALTPYRPILVDFCCGSGHVGFLLAYLFPHCDIVLVEHNATAIAAAHQRLEKLKDEIRESNERIIAQAATSSATSPQLHPGVSLTISHSSITSYTSPFTIGIGLHACGWLSDAVQELAFRHHAGFVIAPCCIGKCRAGEGMKLCCETELDASAQSITEEDVN